MKKVLKMYVETNLIIRIVIGLVIGVLIGLLLPSWWVVGFLGDIFVGALKAIAPVLVFVLVTCSHANAGKGIGKRFRTVITLYMVSTFLAAIVAVIVSRIFPTTLILANTYESDGEVVQGIGEVLQSLFMNMVQNPIKAISEANYVVI